MPNSMIDALKNAAKNAMKHAAARSVRRSSVYCLLGVPLLVAYSQVSMGSPETARFSEASEDEIALVLSSVYLPVEALETELAMAILDSVASRGECPQMVEDGHTESIRGHGCVAASGSRYDGAIEMSELDGSWDDGSQVVFDRYGRTTQDGVHLYYHGVISSYDVDDADDDDDGDEGRVQRLDIDLHAAVQGRRIHVDASRSCEQSDTESTCALDPGSIVDIAGFGRFDAEGTMGVLSRRGAVVFRGEETMRARYGDDGCVRYRIEDGAEQTWCASEDHDSWPELPPPDMPIPGFPVPEMPDMGLPWP